MTIIENISNPYIATLILGFIYGLTFCTSSCLPYIVSYIAGIEAGFSKGVRITVTFNLGRITAYTAIGSLAEIFKTLISDEFFNLYQKYSSIIFGLVVILIGLSIFHKNSSHNTCKVKRLESLGTVNRVKQSLDLRSFIMGLSRGFVLCPPLLALLLYASSLTQINLTLFAFLFGVGTSISPLLFLGGIIGWLLEKATFFRKWITKLGGIILILLGFSVLLLAVIELL